MEIFIGIILFIIVFVRISILNSKIEDLSNKVNVKSSVPVQNQNSAEETKTDQDTDKIDQYLIASEPTPVPIKAAVTAKETPTDNSSTEFKFGARILTSVGILAVLLGVGFFLRYAFENNLISEPMRVGLGVLFGAVLIGTGMYLFKKFSAYAQGLIGAGLGVLYISLYSAYSFYQLVNVETAFVFLAIVAALGIFLALKYESQALIGYSFVGAYIIPLLLPFSPNPHAMFIYLIILAITASILSYKKAYSWLTLSSFFATFFIYAYWQVGTQNDDPSLALTYSTLLFLTYLAANIHALIVHKGEQFHGKDIALAAFAPIFFYLANATTISMHYENGIKLFVFFLAIFYILISLLVRVAWSQYETSKRASNILFMIAIPFMALATALHLHGSWISVTWLVEAAVIIALGTQTKTAAMRYFGLGLYCISIIRVFLLDFALPLNADFIFNTRMLLVLVLIAVSASLWYVYKIILPARISVKDEDEIHFGKGLGLVVAYGSLIIWIVSEFSQFGHTAYLSIIFALCALVGVMVSSAIKENIPRYLAYAVLVLTYGDMMFRYVFNILGDPIDQPVLNLRVLSTIIIIGISAFIIQILRKDGLASTAIHEEKKNLSPILFASSNVLFFIVFSQEVLFYMDFNAKALGLATASTLENTKRITLSLAWLAYAVFMLTIGIMKQYASARIVAIILFAVTILKVFLYDTANLSDIYRFISFISLGIILLLVGFAYYRFRERIVEFIQAK